MRKELVKLGFSRQSNRKADEGSKHPDRDAQFEHINAKVVAAQPYRSDSTTFEPSGILMIILRDE